MLNRSARCIIATTLAAATLMVASISLSPSAEARIVVSPNPVGPYCGQISPAVGSDLKSLSGHSWIYTSSIKEVEIWFRQSSNWCMARIHGNDQASTRFWCPVNTCYVRRIQ